MKHIILALTLGLASLAQAQEFSERKEVTMTELTITVALDDTRAMTLPLSVLVDDTGTVRSVDPTGQVPATLLSRCTRLCIGSYCRFIGGGICTPNPGGALSTRHFATSLFDPLTVFIAPDLDATGQVQVKVVE